MSRQKGTGNKFAYFLYPAALGLAGGLLLPIIAGFTALSVTCALLLSAAALAAGWRLSHLAHSQDNAPAMPQPTAGLRDICLRSFPLWARQIDTTRRAGDEAALNLTQIFAVAVDDIQSALSASRSAVEEISGKDGGVLAAINSSEAALLGVVEIFKAVQLGKKGLLADVKQLPASQEMVGDVQHIALQVRMLSFNAAIEAAHAGAVRVCRRGQRNASTVRFIGGNERRDGEEDRKIKAIDATLSKYISSRTKINRRGCSCYFKADATVREVIEHFKAPYH